MGVTLRNRSATDCLRSLKGECWIGRESSGCEFRDSRLGDRSANCSRRLEAPWTKQHPARMPGLGEYQGSRPLGFFSNDRVSEANILAGHFQSTVIVSPPPSIGSQKRYLVYPDGDPRRRTRTPKNRKKIDRKLITDLPVGSRTAAIENTHRAHGGMVAAGNAERLDRLRR